MKYNLNVAVIGSGYMGKVHLNALNDTVSNLILCTNDTKTGEELKSKYNIKLYTDYNEMFEKEKLDFVSVCLPTHIHYNAVMSALKHNINVLCEKPFSSTVQEAEEMVTLAKEKGLLLMVAHCLRFYKHYEYLKRCISDERFGKLLYLNLFRHGNAPDWSVGGWLNNIELSGGVVRDLHVHDTDMALHLLGMPESVYTTGCATLSNTIYKYNDKSLSVTGSGSWRNTPDMADFVGFDVIFENGSIRFVDGKLSVHNSKGKVENPLENENFEFYFADITGDEKLAEIQYFCHCLTNNLQTDLCLPEDSLKTMKISNAESESLKTKKEIFIL